MQGEHWIIITNFRHELYFAGSRGCKGYIFLNNNNNQHYKQMMPAPLQSHPSVGGFYTIYAAFHLLKFRQEGITAVHDVNVLCFMSNCMYFFQPLYVNVQFILCFYPISYILINFFKILHNLFFSIKSYQYPHT